MKRRYPHTTRLKNRLTARLYRVLMWARNHRYQKGFREKALHKAEVIFHARADELVKYTFRTRIKPQLGEDAKQLTVSDINAFKQHIIKDKMEQFRGILNDFVA